MPKYVCNNFGSCVAAGKVIELPLGADLVCPEDGYELQEIKERSFSLQSLVDKPLLLGAGIALVLVVIGAVWFAMSPSKEEPAPIAISPSTLPTSKPVGISPDATDLAKAKQGVDGKILADGGAGALPDQKAVLAKEYVKAAIPLMQAGKWREAEEQLLKAKNENPEEPLVYYNLAITQLKQSQDKEALASLETAFKKGFKDFGALEADADLKPLTGKPEYTVIAAQFKNK